MIPFLALDKKNKESVSNMILYHSKTKEVFLGVRSAFEEFGVDFDKIKKVIFKLESRGDLEPGLWGAVKEKMEGDIKKGDIDRIPRCVDGYSI